ncbi:odorant receptor 94a-like [Contarinia nasturtii]|uniref:odorant receptor 94a-like n=1 Tax=Contarinia nasturtii TaxID=265458 RepID=UPI0012D48675|nr:odorant receptor 94a-like [Contarinia nasturtii]
MERTASDKALYLKKISDRMLIVFRTVGMWPDTESSIFYSIYGILLLAIFSIAFTSTMMIQLICFTKKEELTETSYMALTELALSVKIINFFLRVRSMQSHLITGNQFKLYSAAEHEHFVKRLKFVFKLLMADFLLTNIAHLSVQIKTIMASERMLAFPAWHPIEWENDAQNYWLIFAYQVIGMTITSNIQVVIQQYPSLMFFLVSIQMEILSMRLRNNGYDESRTSDSTKLTKEDKTIKIFSNEEERRISNTMKDCVNVHYKILKFAKQLERDFTIPFFVQICISGIVICSLANEAARTNDPVKQISFGTILLTMSFQIYFPCYFGNEVMATSNNLSTEMYKSNWIHFNAKQKQMVSMFIEGTKKNKYILIGNLFVLSLQTFSSILNVAYRLLAVIKNTA